MRTLLMVDFEEDPLLADGFFSGSESRAVSEEGYRETETTMDGDISTLYYTIILGVKLLI